MEQKQRFTRAEVDRIVSKIEKRYDNIIIGGIVIMVAMSIIAVSSIIIFCSL